MKNILLIPIFTLFFSCAKFATPPNIPLQELSKKESLGTEERDALTLFKISNGDKVRCKQIQAVSQNKKNPLAKWAYLKFLKLCNKDLSLLHLAYEQREDFPKWLREDLYNIIIRKSDNKEHIAFSMLHRTEFYKSQNDKVKNIQAALKYASDNKFESEPFEKMLEVIAPRFKKNYPDEDRYSVARDLERNRDFKKARAIYHNIIQDKNTSLSKKVRAWNRTRFSYKLERDRKSYLIETQRLVDYIERHIDSDPVGPKLHAKYSLILSRIYWTQGDHDKARAHLRKILANTELESEFAVEALYYQGGISDDLNDSEQAISFYRSSYEKIENNHELTETIIWNIAWFYYRRKMYKEALSWFDKYEQPENSEEISYKFLFWKARTYSKLGQDEDAKEILSIIRDNDPFGYYGQISSIYGPPLPPLKAEENNFDQNSDPLSWAIYINNLELAQKIIDHTDIKDIESYYHAKYFNKMIFKYFSLDTEKKKEILQETPNYSFPLAYKNDFISANKSRSVSAPLLLSIARQESAFNTYARSPADAFGLLQVIPEQAERLATMHKIPYENFNDLYTPEINISVSSLLLDELMKKQDNNFIHFVASYNAGENAVDKWKKRITGFSSLEFIEQIPYKETRKYVKLITRNFLVYKRLLSEKPFTVKKDFFENFSY